MTNDLVGKRFGKLVVVGRDYSYISNKHTKWLCKCDCGNIKSVFRNSLIGGRTNSCGCEQYKGKNGINKTHGLSKERIYHEWTSMKGRCASDTMKSHEHYHDKGIRVCSEWNDSFESFCEWAINNGYRDDLTIDRIDNSKGYCPENCRWVTNAEQQQNKTNTIHVNYNGRDWCLRTLCVEIGFPYKTAHRRYTRMKNRGEPVTSEKLFAPINERKIANRYR